jgi:phenylalanyl-tRNA synthetase beta chain
MPTITVSSHDLYRLASGAAGPSLAELDRQLALVKGELEKLSADGRRLRQVDGSWLQTEEDLALRIELKDTNRPDLWSVEGIARQLRMHTRGGALAHPAFAPGEPGGVIEVDGAVASIRLYIGGFLASDAVLDEAALVAFIEAQETLTRNFGRKRQTVAIGLYRADTLHFPVRYTAVVRDGIRFTPLPPAGDGAPWQENVAMTPAEILERHPAGRAYGAILDGHAQIPLLIDSRGEVLSIPPIINSAGLGRVAPGMTKLFVEATALNQEHGLLALNILAANLADRGWTIVPVATHYPYDTPRGRAVVSPTPMPITQTVHLDDFAQVLGEPVQMAAVVDYLTRYGVQANPEGDIVHATIASYRQDYLHAVDVIEDYAISRGYDAISPLLPSDFTVGRVQPLTGAEDLLRDLMIGFGFEEVFCNILASENDQRAAMGLPSDTGVNLAPFHGGPNVRIANVMSQSYAVLRDWITPTLLEIESHSAGALYPHRIFEVGEVAVFDPADNMGSRTESRLAAIIGAEDASFDTAQSVVYALMASLGLAFRIISWAHPSFIPGRVALIVRGQDADTAQPIGFLGELSPQVLTNWGARTPIAALEITVQGLFDL